ncbi:MAG: hypothetical protein ACW990_03140 [Promethearchaeota archaeon]|jgi:hypothetical protein
MMDVFENLKEIEDIYEDLIKNAKDLNLNDIEEFRKAQIRIFEASINTKNELVNSALGNLTLEVNNKTKKFEERLNDAISKIELDFQNSIKNLQKLIIEKAGIDF